jgi:hypothetical protein
MKILFINTMLNDNYHTSFILIPTIVLQDAGRHMSVILGFFQYQIDIQITYNKNTKS